jgi:hypothetical protein
MRFKTHFFARLLLFCRRPPPLSRQTPLFFARLPIFFATISRLFLIFTSHCLQLASPKRANIFRRYVRIDVLTCSTPPPNPAHSARLPVPLSCRPGPLPNPPTLPATPPGARYRFWLPLLLLAPCTTSLSRSSSLQRLGWILVRLLRQKRQRISNGKDNVWLYSCSFSPDTPLFRQTLPLFR